jgi:hypothetical protein
MLKLLLHYFSRSYFLLSRKVNATQIGRRKTALTYYTDALCAINNNKLYKFSEECNFAESSKIKCLQISSQIKSRLVAHKWLRNYLQLMFSSFLTRAGHQLSTRFSVGTICISWKEFKPLAYCCWDIAFLRYSRKDLSEDHTYLSFIGSNERSYYETYTLNISSFSDILVKNVRYHTTWYVEIGP